MTSTFGERQSCHIRVAQTSVRHGGLKNLGQDADKSNEGQNWPAWVSVIWPHGGGMWQWSFKYRGQRSDTY